LHLSSSTAAFCVGWASSTGLGALAEFVSVSLDATLKFRGVLLASLLACQFGAHRQFANRRSNVVDAGGLSYST
jgi:hypothetical protein